MRFIDTHTHLYLPEFDADRDSSVEKAVNAGVEMMLLPNIDIHSIGAMMNSVERYKKVCFPMIGLHPTSVKDDYACQLEKMEYLLPLYNFVAVGEIGIDLYWDKTYIKEQTQAFKQQVYFAATHNLPVVIHARDSFPEVFSALEELPKNIRGVFHAFSGTPEYAQKVISMGLKLGIGGMITFKNTGLEKVLKNVTPHDIILETDSPYLTPTPFRGKRNESAYLPIINKKISEIYGIQENAMAEISYQNSIELFKL
ncbi:MAG: TatD family hydrolase [Bacteroidales bacterium]|jgi:TatD DNase family protein|nr:TatD family hydrolase [Bacteroidales bacterium]